MVFSDEFRSYARKTCTLNDWVAAPYMRRDFQLSEAPQRAELTVCALGFYELFVNGKKITKKEFLKTGDKITIANINLIFDNKQGK